MEKEGPLAISISRLKGCGGAYIGQNLARSLGMLYLDRALSEEIANKLDESIEYVEQNEERLVGVWESMIEKLQFSNPWSYSPPPAHVPAAEVSHPEMEAIANIAAEKSIVVVGRGASCVLRNHPKHVSVFLYASRHWRLQRTQEIYSLSRADAAKLIDRVDLERARAKKSITGLDICDATQYHIAVDTGVLGLEAAEELILQYIRFRFGDKQIEPPSKNTHARTRGSKYAAP